MNLNTPSFELKNIYNLKLYDGKTNELLQEVEIHNAASSRKYTMWKATGGYYGGGKSNPGLGTVFLGIGTGEIDIDSQTFMFSNKFSSTISWTRVDDHSSFDSMHYQSSATFPATSNYVGELTEIGLGGTGYSQGYYSYLNTHALLTDVEGNPIIISKTDLNVLVVTIDLFIAAKLITQPFDFRYEPPYHSDLGGTFYGDEFPTVGGKTYHFSPRYAPELDSEQIAKTSGISRTYHDNYLSSTKASASIAANTNVTFPCTFTVTNKRIDPATGNFGYAHSIVFPGFGTIPLPNSTICPSYIYKDIAVGIGDGITKTFLSAVNEVVSATVYVDGVVNNNIAFQNFDVTKSPIWNKCIKIDYNNGALFVDIPYKNTKIENLAYIMCSLATAPMSVSVGEIANKIPCGSYRNSATASPIYYDENGITLDHMRIGKENVQTNYSTGARGLVTSSHSLYYSDDCENWNLAVTVNTSYETIYFDAITAKYWKIVGGNGTTSATVATQQQETLDGTTAVDFDPKALVVGNSAVFDFGKCGITFSEAPAEGSVITMDATLNLPYKDSNIAFISSYEAVLEDPGEAK